MQHGMGLGNEAVSTIVQCTIMDLIGHQRKLNPQNGKDCLSVKIEPLENFLLYGSQLSSSPTTQHATLQQHVGNPGRYLGTVKYMYPPVPLTFSGNLNLGILIH